MAAASPLQRAPVDGQGGRIGRGHPRLVGRAAAAAVPKLNPHHVAVDIQPEVIGFTPRTHAHWEGHAVHIAHRFIGRIQRGILADGIRRLLDAPAPIIIPGRRVCGVHEGVHRDAVNGHLPRPEAQGQLRVPGRIHRDARPLVDALRELDPPHGADVQREAGAFNLIGSRPQVWPAPGRGGRHREGQQHHSREGQAHDAPEEVLFHGLHG